MRGYLGISGRVDNWKTRRLPWISSTSCHNYACSNVSFTNHNHKLLLRSTSCTRIPSGVGLGRLAWPSWSTGDAIAGQNLTTLLRGCIQLQGWEHTACTVGSIHFWKSVKYETGRRWRVWQCLVRVLPPLFKSLLKLVNSKPWVHRDSL